MIRFTRVISMETRDYLMHFIRKNYDADAWFKNARFIIRRIGMRFYAEITKLRQVPLDGTHEMLVIIYIIMK